MSSTIVKQVGWRWCSKCSGLAYFGTALCPDGGVHDHSDSGDYTIHNDNSTGGQGQWGYCNNCQTMSWTGQGNGLCPNGRRHDTVNSFNYHLVLDQDNTAGQHDWRYCSKCQGLTWIGGEPGTCVGGGTHDVSGSGNYTLSVDGNGASSGQSKWKHCKKCQLLAYDGFSDCAGGGEHIHTGSGEYTIDYTLADNIASTKGQNNWKYCTKCQALSYAGSSTQGACPESGSHDHTGSGNYVIVDKPLTGAQAGWSWCNKCQMLWYSGNGPARCPQGANSFHNSLGGSGNYSIENTGALLPSIKGTNSVSISSTSTQSTSATQISITPGADSTSNDTASKSSSIGTGAIAGIAIGGVALLLLAIGMFVLLRRRQRSRADQYLVTPTQVGAELEPENNNGGGGFPVQKEPMVNVGATSPPTELDGRILPPPVEMDANHSSNYHR